LLPSASCSESYAILEEVSGRTLKLEHFVRDMLDVPKGLRDLKIAGLDVDIKNTVGGNWSIPLETYRSSEPCLLMAIDDKTFTCSLGLIIAKPAYLHGGAGNRDTKKGVSKAGFENILWLVNGAPFPASRFSGLNMDRFRELRKILAGNERAAQFWRENLGRIVHRDVMQALLFDQRDYMKRLRANGGAPDLLTGEGIAIVIGTYLKDSLLAAQLGIPILKADEIVGIAPRSQDEWELMRKAGVITSEKWTG
jgi:Restriction endonuclease NaeI